MSCFLIRGYRLLPKEELHRSLQVITAPTRTVEDKRAIQTPRGEGDCWPYHPSFGRGLGQDVITLTTLMNNKMSVHMYVSGPFTEVSGCKYQDVQGLSWYGFWKQKSQLLGTWALSLGLQMAQCRSYLQ